MTSAFRARPLHLALVAAALAGGALIRWHHLGRESAWLDEAYSIEIARGSLDGILEQRWTDIHPPLYYIVLHAWIRLAGSTEIGARLLSVAFGLATIVATYAAGSRLVGSGAAAAAALVVAISPFQVEFSQEARMYAQLGLASTLSMWAFVAVLREGKFSAAAGYVAATTVMLYTHIFGVFIVAAEAWIWWWWRIQDADAWRTSWKWLAALAVSMLLYGPWIIVLADQASRVHAAFWIGRPTLKDVAMALAALGGSPLVCLPVAGLAVLGGWQLRHRTQSRPSEERPRPLAILLPWLASPVVVPLVMSWIGTPIFQPKYAIAATIPLALLAGVALTGLARVWKATVVIALAALTTVSFSKYYRSQRRDGWREAVAALESQAKPGDLILFYPAFNRYPFDFYRRRTDMVETDFPLEPMAMSHMPRPDFLQAMARTATGNASRVWLVTLQGSPERVPLGAALERDRTRLERLDIEWIEMSAFEGQRSEDKGQR